MNPSYTRRIQEVYPHLDIQDVEMNNIGQNNDVLIVNQTLVFRFPKYAESFQALIRETQILNGIKTKLTLPIPNPMYVSFDDMQVGKMFMGYPLIEGQPLWTEDLLSHRNSDIEDRLAEQMIEFLIQLHAVEINEWIAGDKQIVNVHEEMSGLYTQIQNLLFGYIRPDAQVEISSNFTGFLNNPANHDIRPSCIHGDFGTSNILWIPEKGRITGIIDFGGSGIGDPAYDLAGILSGYGQAFFDKCIAMYPNGEQIAERVHFYRSTFALQESLHGVIHQDAEAFEAGIRDFR
ncbi:aminoglycoside phosphotransferase family protein [Paenibacillus lautus]|uniref:phosphotransferase family protein n=1 Tax=Paenibacillus lautus TaxID=1401 RepID=UPI002DBF7D08|nr:aminoglycoside phosphotransferase family protein [Paenibacillus lautus]MEC0307465.1 aminoglycoside phosphotransferase family protein [Paenibacillus lautus]